MEGPANFAEPYTNADEPLIEATFGKNNYFN